MKTKRALLPLAVLMFAGLTASGQEGAIVTKTQLRAALATAKTPADHARIAYYYHGAARTYAQSQAEEEQIAAQWQKQYEGWAKTPNPYDSAKKLAAWYGQQASDALTHAEAEDKLANTQALSWR